MHQLLGNRNNRALGSTNYRKLVDALKSDGITGPEPEVPLGIAIEIQQQLDRQDARAQPNLGREREDPQASTSSDQGRHPS